MYNEYSNWHKISKTENGTQTKVVLTGTQQFGNFTGNLHSIHFISNSQLFVNTNKQMSILDIENNDNKVLISDPKHTPNVKFVDTQRYVKINSNC